MMRACLLLACISAAARAACAQTLGCESCVPARYWEIDRDFWRSSSGDTPEATRLKTTHPVDLGIAFSGGGTRSASATIGELRGLRANGWLSRVRYVAAVSGGSWAAVPFSFFNGSLDELLGTPAPLDPRSIRSKAEGRLAACVVNSSFLVYGIEELPGLLPNEIGAYNVEAIASAVKFARDAVNQLRGHSTSEPDRANKTYARSLGQIFLDPLIPRASSSPYAWDRETAIEMAEATGGALADYVVQPADRPFLIVGGSLVKPVGDAYPRLVPVEYTSLYTGIRQHFGALGGTYVWPWAYDRLYVAPRSTTEVLVGPGPTTRVFSLADMIASSGAAPQLTLLLGSGVPERLQRAAAEAARIFPSFSNVTVNAGVPEPPSQELPHGDGGFTDNYGLLPLLARRVRNIIVFVNSADEYNHNDGLQTYFVPVERRGGDGDKTMNVVFDRSHYEELLNGFDASTSRGSGALYCARDWSVLPNALYNVQPYKVNICWVYNYAARNWRATRPSEIQAWLDQASATHLRELKDFPYYGTFEENAPHLIKLSNLQVNLLADLAAWSVMNPDAVTAMTGAFGTDVLPPPPRQPR
jgi:hypothetical protein